jgi:hypothetical protein
MSKRLIAISAVLLGLSLLLGIVNGFKARTLRADSERIVTAQQETARLTAQREQKMKAREAAVTAANAKLKENEAKVATAEEELIKTQTERQDLLTKVHDNETEIAELKKRIEAGGIAAPGPGGTGDGAPGSAATLQTQLEETKKQLDSAEKEKSLLADKIRAAQERSDQLEAEKKQRAALRGNPNLRGTVLAVNQAYNFVVLNLGARQGVESNSEMLVLREGTLIGKIRISSVEPATSIGDIISTSLARGVQVQPGDVVVYAGSNS